MRYCLLLMLLLAGCTSSSQPIVASNNPQQHDECIICKMNADLACVDVAVDRQTPSYTYHGKTYHFCSDDCRDTFAKNPARYAGK